LQATPHFKVLPSLKGLWEEDTAFHAFANYARSSSARVDAIFAYNDPMALGVARYFDEHPRLKRPLIIGVDGVLVGQRGVLAGKLSASVVQSPEVMGKIGVRNLMSCISENRFEKTIVLTPVALLKPGLALETMEVH
jgi:ABC-type sugar transport system substrate-binding protein